MIENSTFNLNATMFIKNQLPESCDIPSILLDSVAKGALIDAKLPIQIALLGAALGTPIISLPAFAATAVIQASAKYFLRDVGRHCFDLPLPAGAIAGALSYALDGKSVLLGAYNNLAYEFDNSFNLHGNLYTALKLNNTNSFLPQYARDYINIYIATYAIEGGEDYIKSFLPVKAEVTSVVKKVAKEFSPSTAQVSGLIAESVLEFIMVKTYITNPVAEIINNSPTYQAISQSEFIQNYVAEPTKYIRNKVQETKAYIADIETFKTVGSSVSNFIEKIGNYSISKYVIYKADGVLESIDYAMFLILELGKALVVNPFIGVVSTFNDGLKVVGDYIYLTQPIIVNDSDTKITGFVDDNHKEDL